MTKISNLTLEDWFYIAGIVSFLIALATYVSASLQQRRQRSIENALRYLDYHSKIFGPGSYCRANVRAMEQGTYKRDPSNQEMELKFNEFLSGCEHLALLQGAGAVPDSINAYMLGWFAKHIYPALTDREKAEPYWELAIDFLRETKLSADKLDAMSKQERLTYLRKNHFA